MSDTPPRHRVILTVKIHADDLAGAARELHILSNNSVEWETRSVEHGLAIYGGTYSITTDVDMTALVGEEYIDALLAWRDRKRESNDQT